MLRPRQLRAARRLHVRLACFFTPLLLFFAVTGAAQLFMLHVADKSGYRPPAVLETLGSGIAIFGPDMRLKFFNTAYAHLWGLEEEALKDEPHLNDIHELLRERRRQAHHRLHNRQSR